MNRAAVHEAGRDQSKAALANSPPARQLTLGANNKRLDFQRTDESQLNIIAKREPDFDKYKQGLAGQS